VGKLKDKVFNYYINNLQYLMGRNPNFLSKMYITIIKYLAFPINLI